MAIRPQPRRMPKTAALWSTLVAEDIKSARILIDAGMTRNGVLMSASALEKALKCYLFCFGELSSEDASHNTLMLAKKCGFMGKAPKEVASAFVLLKSVHVSVSYPESKWALDSMSDLSYSEMVYDCSACAIKWVYGELMEVVGGRGGHGEGA